jgi:hypothetical protein
LLLLLILKDQASAGVFLADDDGLRQDEDWMIARFESLLVNMKNAQKNERRLEAS